MRKFTGTALLLATAAIISYSNIYKNDFVYFDDNVYITENVRVQQGLTRENIGWAFTAFDAGNWHPLTWLSHMLDVRLFGLNPAGHHSVNLLFHVLAALLLFGSLRCATGKFRPSALVAALFALHPLHVESVAWAAERKDVLSAVFWFAALWAYARYAQRPGFGRYAAVLALFSLGLMAKPMLVTLPFILLLFDFWPLGRRTEGKNTVPFLLAEKMPFFVLSLASAVVTVIAQQEAIGGLGRVGAGARVTNALAAYGIYLWQTVWPAGLAVYYPHPERPQVAGAIAAALFLAAVTAVCLRLSRKNGYLLTGWLWYLITLVPVIGIVQVGGQAHADRYTYLPLIGLFVMAAWAAGDLVKARPVLKKPLMFAAAAVLVCMGFLTHRTASYWKNDLTLFGRAVTAVPGNYPMKVKLGDALFARGKNEEALREFRESLAIRPSGYAYAGLGALYHKKGELDRALEYYQKAMALDPGIKSAILNAGKTYLRLARFSEAEQLLHAAVARDPAWGAAWLVLGQALTSGGRLVEGESAFRKAVALEPAPAEARQGLGNALAMQGNFAAAADEYRESLRFAQNNITLMNLGSCLSATGRKVEAIAAYETSLALDDKNAEARYGLAIVLADLGRKAEAIEQLRQAMDLAPQNGEIRMFFKTLSGDKR